MCSELYLDRLSVHYDQTDTRHIIARTSPSPFFKCIKRNIYLINSKLRCFGLVTIFPHGHICGRGLLGSFIEVPIHIAVLATPPWNSPVSLFACKPGRTNDPTCHFLAAGRWPVVPLYQAQVVPVCC